MKEFKKKKKERKTNKNKRKFVGLNEANEEIFDGVLNRKKYRLKQKQLELPELSPIFWFNESDPNDVEKINEDIAVLQKYFRTSVDLDALYHKWSTGCKRFAAVSPFVPGIAILQQDPYECLISFICSSNNNVRKKEQDDEIN